MSSKSRNTAHSHFLEINRPLYTWVPKEQAKEWCYMHAEQMCEMLLEKYETPLASYIAWLRTVLVKLGADYPDVELEIHEEISRLANHFDWDEEYIFAFNVSCNVEYDIVRPVETYEELVEYALNDDLSAVCEAINLHELPASSTVSNHWTRQRRPKVLVNNISLRQK